MGIKVYRENSGYSKNIILIILEPKIGYSFLVA